MTPEQNYIRLQNVQLRLIENLFKLRSLKQPVDMKLTRFFVPLLFLVFLPIFAHTGDWLWAIVYSCGTYYVAYDEFHMLPHNKEFRQLIADIENEISSNEKLLDDLARELPWLK